MSQKEYIRSRWFEDLPIGEFHVFGSHTFTEDEIISFGSKYAPQPYHTDPEGAYDSLYRGLVASEWHLAAIWMRLMVTYMERYASGVQDGRRNGAGVSVMNMQWLKPVRPGHTLTYTYEIVDKLERTIRNRWGVIRSRNEAFNQSNERVFSFEIDILAELNPEKLNPEKRQR